MRTWALARASADPARDPAVAIPEWYLRHWHYGPGGYLTGPGRAWYGWVVSRLYHQLGEGDLAQKVVAELRRAGARRVLEAGCGPGRHTGALARAGFDEVAAVDLAPAWVRATRRRAPGADVRHADATALPWATGHFDAAVAVHVLGHVPAGVADAILREARRVTRPGGVIAVVEHPWHGPAFAAEEAVSRRRWRLGMQAMTVLHGGRDTS
jgi:SAM-dependent methyltransferase